MSSRKYVYVAVLIQIFLASPYGVYRKTENTRKGNMSLQIKRNEVTSFFLASRCFLLTITSIELYNPIKNISVKNG